MGNEYRALRKSKLKEMYIVRYADDFKIFCKTRSEAVKIKAAVTDWLSQRLKLQVSKEKTSITNLKRKYSEFLGFKFKLKKKGKKEVVNAQMSDKAVTSAKLKLKNQIKFMQRPKNGTHLYQCVNVYNSMVMGLQNYYGIANNVCINLAEIQNEVRVVMKNRLNIQNLQKSKEWKTILSDSKIRTNKAMNEAGVFTNSYLAARYGKSKQVRWIMGMPLVPIGYYKSRNPMDKKASINQYTPEGRAEMHKKSDMLLESIMHYIMRNPVIGRSVEYNDNRVSLYMGQLGKCAITGELLEIGEMHCHHKLPIHLGGTDEYSNLIFVTEDVHRLIHATNPDTISKYLKILSLDEKQLTKLGKLRKQAGLEEIKLDKSDI